MCFISALDALLEPIQHFLLYLPHPALAELYPFREHSNLLVLTLTTSAARASEIIAKLGTDGNPAFLFKAVDGVALTCPAPQLLTEPWTRAGLPPLSIAESR